MNLGLSLGVTTTYQPIPAVGLDPEAAIAALFESGEVGAWYDPSDSTTVFQDAAGTTPATVGDPVGLILDKSQGLTLGAELASNILDSTANWSFSTGDVTVSGGQLVFTSAPSTAPIATYNPILTNGVRYKVTFTVSGSGLVGCKVGSAGDQYIALPAGTHTFYGKASGGTPTQISWSGTASAINYFVGTIDNISIRELPGNHATQSTSTARPTLAVTGTTPATLGSELVTNGTFDSGTTGWSAVNSTLSVSSQRLVITSATAGAANVIAHQTVGGLVAGRTYKATISSVQLNGLPSSIRVGNGAGQSQIVNVTLVDGQDQELFFQPTSSSHVISALFYDNTGDPSKYIVVDNITVKEVLTWADPKYYLDFDGVDDKLTTAAVDLSGTNQLAVAAGVRDVAMTGGRGTIFNTNLGNYNGFSMFAPNASTNTLNVAGFGDVGGGSFSLNESGLPNSLTAVLLANTDLSTTTNVLRRDGAVVATHGIAGAGTYTNTPLHFGHRGSTFYFSGNLCGCVVIDRTLTAGEIDSLETYLADKSGVTL